jgi:hypothetical protein
MARRKSGWQQFADNFSSVYDTFSGVAQDWETGDIMGEEAEEFNNDDGSSYWMYNKKRYDKQITPERLQGLRYNRLADVSAKWGDPKGAMEMRQSAATLEDQQRKNRLGERTFEAKAMEPFLANLRVISQTGVNDANRESIQQSVARDILVLPLDMREKALNNAKIMLGNDFQGVKNYIQEKSKDEQVRTYGLGNQKTESDINLNTASTGLTKSRNKAVDLDNISKEATQQSDINAQISDNDVTIGGNKKIIASNQMWEMWSSDVQSGLYGDDDEAAVQGFLSYMTKVDPIAAEKLRKTHNTNTISFITQETMRYQAEAQKALSKGGIDGIKAFIDKDNGIGLDVEIEEIKDANGTITGYDLVEVPADGKEGERRVIATGKTKQELGMAAMQSTQPGEMLPYLSEQAEVNLKKAQTAYNLAKAKAESKGKGKFSEKAWAVERMSKNPDDPLAWAMLLNIGDLTLEDVVTMQKDGRRTGASNAAEGGDDSGGDGAGDGDENEVVVQNNAGVSGVTEFQVDSASSLNEQKSSKAKSMTEIQSRMNALRRELGKDLVPWTLDRNLPAADYEKQKSRDETLSWLNKEGGKTFIGDPLKLQAFEKDPVGWWLKNVKNKGDTTTGLSKNKNTRKQNRSVTKVIAGKNDQAMSMTLEHFRDEDDAREFLRSMNTDSPLPNGGVYYIKTKDGNIIK